MPVEYSHKCNKCSYAVFTSGPWEFYRDNEGRRKQYGHPAPISLEAAKTGIYGYSATVYCPDCDRTSNVVLREYKKPYRRRRNSFLLLRSVYDFPIPKFMLGLPKLKEEYKKEDAVKCPKCGNTNLVRPDEDEVRIVTCLRCKEGQLIPQRERIF